MEDEELRAELFEYCTELEPCLLDSWLEDSQTEELHMPTRNLSTTSMNTKVESTSSVELGHSLY